jgi:WD40 repeat protein
MKVKSALLFTLVALAPIVAQIACGGSKEQILSTPTTEANTPTVSPTGEQPLGGAYERSMYERAEAAAVQGDWVLATLLFGEAYRVNPAHSDVEERLQEARAHSGRLLAIQNGQVTATSIDGGEVEPLFAVPERYWRNMRWSLDGNRIAYLGSSGEIRVIDGDGTNDRFVTELEFPDDLAWSPDSQQILFAADYDTGIVDATSGTSVELGGCVGDHQVRGVAWENSGRSIAFWAWMDHELWVASPDGNDCVLLAEDVYGGLLSWSPDDQSIILGADGVLYRVPRLGGSPIEIAHVCADWIGMGALAWSLDGSYLAVTVEESVSVVNVMTGEVYWLHMETDDASSLGWLPPYR